MDDANLVHRSLPIILNVHLVMDDQVAVTRKAANLSRKLFAPCPERVLSDALAFLGVKHGALIVEYYLFRRVEFDLKRPDDLSFR